MGSAEVVVLLVALCYVSARMELSFPEEVRLKNIRQLTFGGINALATFNPHNGMMLFQAQGQSYHSECDHIYRMDTQLSIEQQVASRISTGIGACTRAMFYPDGKNILYAGTFKLTNLRTIVAENPCPQKMCSTQNERADAVLNRFCRQFTWELFPSYDIFEVNQYGNVLRQLTDSLGYDAESAISPDGSKIVFTSMRSGDPEIWIMNSDGSDPVQLTHERGYDGGASFSPDGKKIVFRASRPTTELEIEEYDKMLSYNLVSPLKMEIYTMNVDGTNMRQITDFGASSWGATYMYDSKRIIFTSNYEHVGRCGVFHIYMIEEETRHIEQITYTEDGFDAYGAFNRLSTQFIWSSSRNAITKTEVNVFIADWIDVLPLNRTRRASPSRSVTSRASKRSCGSSGP